MHAPAKISNRAPADASRAAALVDPDAAWRALYDLDDDTEDEPEASDGEWLDC